MISHPQSHRWRPLSIATHPILKRQPQGSMSAMEVVVKELSSDERIPGRIPFGKRMRFARERIEPIAQRPVAPFHMHRPSWLQACSQRGTDFDGEQSSMLIAMLDRLRQGDRFWDDPGRTPPFARSHPLAIGSHQDAPLAVPPIAEPRERAMVSTLDRGDHGLLKEFLIQWAGGASDHKTTVPILDEASPVFSLVRLPISPVFFAEWQTSRE
jgi:hypothetical protein